MIGPFRGRYIFLSNFYLVPIAAHGRIFPTAEHAYQWHKAFMADNHPKMDAILSAATPGEAKRLGRTFPLPPVWEEPCSDYPYPVKANIMRLIIEEKFPIGSVLATLLLDTGTEELAEINNWGDHYWGLVASPDPERPYHGLNMLGQILMARRDTLRFHGNAELGAVRLAERLDLRLYTGSASAPEMGS